MRTTMMMRKRTRRSESRTLTSRFGHLGRTADLEQAHSAATQTRRTIRPL